ncbi:MULTISPECIES: hypothetical protein [Clostridium]|uniref:Uncharacterized protein n=1 Tax=Clostridium ragsdalei P11 TaxID=1353534 RepID=A0A1A6AVN6_9CLOT|nr:MULTISPECIES: hypothetical protein [Clostridium]OBR94151.1 hypothetical protein CLRAG_16910 [Clostridium ragsdalei P11]QXE20957.1 hypothetical protein B5S50_20045 [Clostridium sp. 001]
MITLFNEYKDAGKISEALMVGRNMVNQDHGDVEKFSTYLELLLSLAERLPSLDERKQFVGQANVTLAFFEENADLNVELVEKINTYKNRIDEISSKLITEENERTSKALKGIEASNNKFIKELYQAKQVLSKANSQEEVDKVLVEISQIDAKIEHDYLTDEQKTHYDQINKECTACISDKMRKMEHKSNVAYNKKAVESYNKAFKMFKNDEEKYKNQTQLFSLVSSTLFAYDAARLFNETLIYYNHVYSYIFGKLDDDGKLALTRFSIECERKLR